MCADSLQTTVSRSWSRKSPPYSDKTGSTGLNEVTPVSALTKTSTPVLLNSSVSLPGDHHKRKMNHLGDPPKSVAPRGCLLWFANTTPGGDFTMSR